MSRRITHLVLAHPECGTPMERSLLSNRPAHAQFCQSLALVKYRRRCKWSSHQDENTAREIQRARRTSAFERFRWNHRQVDDTDDAQNSTENETRDTRPVVCFD